MVLTPQFAGARGTIDIFPMPQHVAIFVRAEGRNMV
jgi:hypothetical protein